MGKLFIKDRFGQAPNELLNSTKISLSAKGLFAFIQSKPDRWDFSSEKISFQTKESPKVINKYLQELEKHGYLKRIKKSKGRGLWEIEYHLSFIPFSSNENTSNEISSNDKGLNNSKKDISKKDISKKDDGLNDSEIELLLEVHGEVKGWQIINQLNSTDNAKERFLKYHKEKIKTKHDWAKHFVEKNEIEFNGFAFKQKIPTEKLKGLLRKFISDLMQEKRNVNCLESEFLRHFKNWIKKQA